MKMNKILSFLLVLTLLLGIFPGAVAQEQNAFVLVVESGGRLVIALDGTIETQYAVLTVQNPKAPEGSTAYRIAILKSPPVLATFDIQPGGALLAVYETMSGQRIWPDGDTFSLCEGYSYRYVLSCWGYTAKTGVLTVTRSESDALIVTDGETVHPVEESDGGGALTLSWTLEQRERQRQFRLPVHHR